jgi:hypothetical protein
MRVEVRQHPQGRQARRPAGRTIDQVEFAINLQTAKLLGIEVPPTLLATVRGDRIAVPLLRCGRPELAHG